MASIACSCGAVQIQFRTEAPLFRLECCCHDCRAAVWYAHAKKGGPSPPENEMFDSNWFPNDFTILKGQDQIGSFMNFAGADTTRFHCKDCWTCLFGDHPAYGGKIVLTQVTNFTGFGGLSGADLPEPMARHFLKDLTSERAAALPAWAGDPAAVYQGVADNLMAALPQMMEGGATGEMNAQALQDLTGPPFVPDDELERMAGGPPTLMAQGRAAAEVQEASGAAPV